MRSSSGAAPRLNMGVPTSRFIRQRSISTVLKRHTRPTLNSRVGSQVLKTRSLLRQRKTVAGWTITKPLRQPGHQRDKKIQNRRSQRRKQGRGVPLRLSTAI
jgi:hypothetical protein